MFMQNLEKFIADIAAQKKQAVTILLNTTDQIEEIQAKIKISELKTVEKYIKDFIEWELQDQRKLEDIEFENDKF